jgi:hypothetical protein
MKTATLIQINPTTQLRLKVRARIRILGLREYLPARIPGGKPVPI